MKKLLSVVVMMLLALLFVWAILSWYFGAQAEKDFRQTLAIHADKPGEKIFRLELLDYKKHMLSSTAAIRVSSDVPLLNDYLGDFVLTLKSLNGPVFITKKGIDFGASRWFIRIDPDSFSPEARENLYRIFPEVLPTGVLIIDFDKESNFESSFKAAWLDATLTAHYNVNTSSYQGALAIMRLNYTSPIIQLSANQGEVHFQYPKPFQATHTDTLAVNTQGTQVLKATDNQASYKTVSIQIPQLVLGSPLLSQPIVSELKGRSQITLRDNEIDALLRLDASVRKNSIDKTGKALPIDQLQLTAQASGIQQSSFVQLMETKAELDNLRMQIQWELEETGELPEGQDKIWQLQNQIDRLNQQYPLDFYQALFTASKAHSQANAPMIKILSSNASGQSTLSGQLKPASHSAESTRLTDLLEAEASVTLDDLLYDFISQHSAIRKKQFSLLYKHNKLLMQ